MDLVPLLDNEKCFCRIYSFFRFAFVIDTVDAILSILGFIFNTAALVTFTKRENGFGFPIK